MNDYFFGKRSFLSSGLDQIHGTLAARSVGRSRWWHLCDASDSTTYIQALLLRKWPVTITID